MNAQLQNVSAGGLLIAIGIIYGNIGTYPLYTFQTILRDGVPITPDLVLGGISCVFWGSLAKWADLYGKQLHIVGRSKHTPPPCAIELARFIRVRLDRG